MRLYKPIHLFIKEENIMAEKTINTRLKLKIDSFEQCTQKNPLLLNGEVIFATVTEKQEGKVNSVPTVIAKVGDGVHKFNELEYLYARASDVYDWAKAEKKPAYSATEITGLADYISGEIQDTDTQYQLVKTGDMTFKIQSKPKGGSTWTDVGDPITLVAPAHTLATGTENGTVAFDGENVAVKGLGSAAYQDSTAFDAAGSKDAAIKAAKDAADAAQATADKKVASVGATEGKGIEIGGTATTPTVGIKLDPTAGNAATMSDKGLMVAIPAADEYSVTKDENSGDYAAIYHLTKGGVNTGVAINIPKDMVVKSGTVEKNPTGQAKGTYLVLTLANATEDKVYIPVDSLIEYVTSGSAAGDMIVVSVSDDHKVTATITDGSITKEKLTEAVQTSLNKADTALQPADVPGYADILTKTEASQTYVAKETGKQLMSDEQAAKLAGIADGAQVNVIESVKVNGKALAIDGKSVNVTVPTGAMASKDKVAESDLDFALSAIAKSGNINDLIQSEGDVLIFDCGNATI